MCCSASENLAQYVCSCHIQHVVIPKYFTCFFPLFLTYIGIYRPCPWHTCSQKVENIYGDITIHFLALPFLRHFCNALWNTGGALRELWQFRVRSAHFLFFYLIELHVSCFFFIVPYTVPHSFCHFPCSHSPDQENTFETPQLSVIHLEEFSNCSSCLNHDQKGNLRKADDIDKVWKSPDLVGIYCPETLPC